MNITSIINAFTVITPLLPYITNAIKTVEADNVGVKGDVKLKLAMDIIRAIYTKASPPVPFDTFVETITDIIAVLVAHYNQIGAFFKHSAVKAA